ncbi:hypothetical protein YC2023_069365 [Brassica napus]
MFNFTSYYVQDKSTGPVTKEELGKATWTFLHTLAAQSVYQIKLEEVKLCEGLK